MTPRACSHMLWPIYMHLLCILFGSLDGLCPWSLSFARVIALRLVETIPTPYPPFYDPCCHLPPMKKEFHARHFVVPIILARVMSTVSYVNGMLHSNCMYNWAWWGIPT